MYLTACETSLLYVTIVVRFACRPLDPELAVATAQLLDVWQRNLTWKLLRVSVEQVEQTIFALPIPRSNLMMLAQDAHGFTQLVQFGSRNLGL